MIASHTSLVDACACGQAAVVAFLIDLDTTDLDGLGPDGMSPLCVAATWGYDEIVRQLLDAGCDPNVRNQDGVCGTALHAAACQEHGKIIHLLLQAGADGTLADAEGRTACDFASISDGLWPLFAARGLPRTPKDVLVAKRVIHKVDPALAEFADATADGDGKGGDGDGGSSSSSSGGGTLPFYSRPGSAYVRSDSGGGSFGGGGVGGGSGGSGGSSGSSVATLPRVPEHIGGAAGGDLLGESVDPLEHLNEAPPEGGQPGFMFWRDD